MATSLRRQPGVSPSAEGKHHVKKVRKKFSLFSIRAGVDMPFLILVLTLLAIGLIMLFSASFAYSLQNFGNSYYFIRSQAIFAVLGTVIMLVISYFDYHHLHKFAYPIMIVVLLMLAAVKLFADTPIAPIRGGANRWLNLGFIEFQPSEIAKFSIILIFAHLMSINYRRMDTFRYGVAPYAIILGLFAGLVIIEKHVSGTLIISAVAMMMMFVGGTKLRYFAILGGIGGAAVAYLVFFSSKFSYALLRIQGWLNPFNPPEGVDTWQTVQSLYAIGSGQLFGVGLGQSRQKYLWLPEPQNDFIFAIVCEELGFIGALVIIILFSALIWRGVVIALAAKDRFGMFLGIGIAMQVGLQVVLNIMVVTNTIPNTGISLPFFSSGGTSLVILLAEMGVLLSISRTSHIEKT